jgi:hypothetical protein
MDDAFDHAGRDRSSASKVGSDVCSAATPGIKTPPSPNPPVWKGAPVSHTATRPPRLREKITVWVLGGD